MLRCRIDAAQELVVVHHQHSDNQDGGVAECSCIFRVGGRIDQNIREHTNKYNDDGTCNEHRGLEGVEHLCIEVIAVFGVVFLNGRHIPRLEKDGGNGGNQVWNFTGNTVDTGCCIAHQSSRAGHVPQEQPVGEAGNDPENGRRNQRNGKADHHTCGALIQITQIEIAMQIADHPKCNTGQQVG